MLREIILLGAFLTFATAFAANSNREFSVDKIEGENPLQVTFDASNIKPAKKFVWSFGNGETVTSSNSSIIYSYNTPGIFTASLKYDVNASDKNPNYKEAGSVVIVVKKKANLAPIAFNTCSTSNLLVNCNGLSSFDPEGQPIQFEFDYGDGVSEQSSNGVVTHSYAQAGLYQVRLKVTDSLGASSVATTQVQAVKPPNVLPKIQLACTLTRPQQMDCSAEGSSDSDGFIVSYQYIFDDNFQTLSSTASHIFSSAGIHSVTLKALDNDGGESTKTVSVELKVNTAPDVELYASTTNGVAPLTVNFEARNALDTDGSVASLEWTFPDGSISYGQTVTKTFNDVGSLNVSLKVTDNLGASTVKSTTITMLEPLKLPPTAYFKYDQGEKQGTYLTLHASQMKTQFDIKRAFYKVDNSRIIELNEFLANTLSTVEMGTYGPHTITFTVVDVRDQVSSFTHNFNLKSNSGEILPYVNFNFKPSAPRTFFFNFNLSFTSDYGEEIEHFHIDYGDGYSEDTTDYYTNHEFPSVGTYLVRVTAYTTTGTRNIAGRNVLVTNDPAPVVLPVAAFTYKIFSVAQNVSFYDERSGSPNGGIISYLWDFGDGATATGKDIVHFYDPGSYFVKLTVTDFAGYTSSQTQHVTIAGTGDDLVAGMWCEQHYVTADCFATALDKYNQINHVQFNWGDDQNSQGELIDEGRGIYHAQHVYGNDGDYSVVVNVGNERGQFKNVSSLVSLINNAPMVGGVQCDLYNLEVYCYPLNSSDPEGGALRYEFSYGDGVVESNADGLGHHFYSGPGNFTVSMKAFDPLGKSVTVQTGVSIVNHLPVLGEVKCDVFGSEVYCYPTQAFDPDGGALSFEFDYGDGNVETNLEALGHHFYSQFGTFNVKLKVIDPFGGTASTQTVVSIVNYPPVASLNCFVNNLLVQCNTAGSYDPEGGSLHFKFDFGDGVVEENDFGYVTHAYANAGLRTVSLLVVDEVGNSGVASAQVMPVTPPNQLPIAKFNCESIRPLTVNCYDTGSFDGDGKIVSRRLSFDDNGYDFLNPPEGRVHQFETAGDHSITFTVVDNDGGVGTITKNVIVKENHNPIANFECNTYGPQRLSCYSISSDPDQSDYVTSFSWEFGDSETQDGLAGFFDHTYFKSDEYTVKLKVRDLFGAEGEISKKFKTIDNVAPVAIIDCQNVGILSINCQSFSYDSDGRITQVDWLIDGKTKLSGSYFDHIFQDGENHQIVLTVKDDLGVESTVIYDAKVITNQLPTFQIIADTATGNSPLKVHLKTLNANDNDGNIVTFNWNFGDGSYSNLPEVDHIFESAGVYNVKLKLTDNLGGETENNIQIYVFDSSNPAIITNIDEGFANLEIKFDTSLAHNEAAQIIQYEWLLDDKQISTVPSFDYLIDEAGTHEIILKVKNAFGEVNYFSKNITVKMPEPYYSMFIPPEILKGTFLKKEIVVSSPKESTVSFEIINKPLGLEVDEISNLISWDTSLVEEGVHEFSVKISDGQNSYSRKYQVNIKKRLTVADLDVSKEGGQFVIGGETVLKGTTVNLPARDENYKVKIETSDDLINPLVHIESSDGNSIPVQFTFPQNLLVSTVVPTSDSLDNSGGGSTKHVEVPTRDYEACEDFKAKVESANNNFSDYTEIPSPIKSTHNKIQFFIHSNLKNALDKEKVEKLIRDYFVFNKIPNNEILKIYFLSTSDKELYGEAYSALPNIIKIYPTSSKDYPMMRFSMFHEFYHTRQYKYFGCGEYQNKVREKNRSIIAILESSANYFAFKNQENSIRIPYKLIINSKEEVRSYTDLEYSIRNRLQEKQIPDFYLSEFRTTLLSGYMSSFVFDSYYSFYPIGNVENDIRYIDEKVQVKDEELLKYLIANKDKYSLNNINLASQLLRDFLVKNGKNPESWLLTIAENLFVKNPQDNRNSIESLIVNYLRDNFVTGWGELPTDTLSNNNLNQPSEVQIYPGSGITLGTMGISYKNVQLFSEEKSPNQLNHFFMNMITFENADDVHSKMVYQRLNFFNWNTWTTDLFPISNGIRKIVYTNGDLFGETDPSIRFTIANTGAPKETKLTITPLCQEFDVPKNLWTLKIKCSAESCANVFAAVFFVYENVSDYYQSQHQDMSSEFSNRAWDYSDGAGEDIYLRKTFSDSTGTFTGKMVVCQPKADVYGIKNITIQNIITR